jgi:hypothetical protein
MQHEEMKEERGDGSEESWDVVSNEDQSQSPPRSQSQIQSPPQSQSQIQSPPPSQPHTVSLGNPIN